MSEIRMHWVRWLLTTGWLLIIGSLVFDPFTAAAATRRRQPKRTGSAGRGEGLRVSPMRPGQVLDELEVLSHGATENTIVAKTAGTRVLAVPVDCFDAALERDADFARRVLALETRQLQRITRQPAGARPGGSERHPTAG